MGLDTGIALSCNTQTCDYTIERATHTVFAALVANSCWWSIRQGRPEGVAGPPEGQATSGGKKRDPEILLGDFRTFGGSLNRTGHMFHFSD
jgi:hypothetical protein